MSKPTFDIDAALQALRDGQDLTGKDGILTPLIKQLTEAAMQAELDNHLAEEAPAHSRGHPSPTTFPNNRKPPVLDGDGHGRINGEPSLL